jgi:hypothetical protein
MSAVRVRLPRPPGDPTMVDLTIRLLRMDDPGDEPGTVGSHRTVIVVELRDRLARFGFGHPDPRHAFGDGRCAAADDIERAILQGCPA